MELNRTETEELFITNEPPRNRWRLSLFIGVMFAFGVFALAGASLYFTSKAPASFVSPTVVTIEPGTSVKTITQELETQSIVRSGSWLYLVLNIFFEPENIKASTYVFERPLTSFEVASRLVEGDFGNDLIKFTHYEGERATSIAKNAKDTLINFDEAHFLERAVPLEGKLYPETYHIPKTYTADELVVLMTKTFSERTSNVALRIESHPLSSQGVIVLASILEREANSPESMRIVSGILQSRMATGMPLQADASIEYILDKPLKELTAEDLKVDSPYNTYTNRGLPPTPIGNPGLDAIMAVLEPTNTDYVFYITDNNGEFHYAKTYDEHLTNIEQYLR